ncbi:MAG: hypothetical protein ACYDEX_12915 [Mobilitalea sp.]
MSYQEKRIIFTIITGVLILGAYCIYAYGKFQSSTAHTEDIKFWAGAILMFVGIGVVVNIVNQIVFHILIAISIAVKEKMRNGMYDDKEIEKTIKNEMVTDEMDQLIELKSMRTGFFVSGIGFLLGLLLLVLNYSPIIMINIMFISFLVGSLLEGFIQLHYYRKGV